MIPFVDLKAQYATIKEEVNAAIQGILDTCQFTLGSEVAAFENEFASYCQSTFGIGVNTGTSALHLSLLAADIGPGDEVITVPFTFVATVAAISYTGATPVFVDIDPRTYTMDPKAIEAAITPRTRAIIPVHLYGQMADMDPIMEIAKKHGLYVVEDACQAILAEIDGKRAGTWGQAAGFSLHPLKNLNVWGDGGVVVTNDHEIAGRLRLLRNHGLKNRDEVEILGYNSRLDSVQAVVGNWLIDQASDITRKRIDNAAWYDQAFADVPQIRIPRRRQNVRRVYHLYMVFAEDRDGLYRHCLANGVEAKIHYPIPLYQQRALAGLGYRPGDFPESDRQAASVISFPCDQHLTREQLECVVETVRGYYGA